MLKKNNLSLADYLIRYGDYINGIDAHVRRTLALKEKLTSYKVGDVFIKEDIDSKSVDKTTTGEPIKFKVVHVTPEGIPYLQRLSSSGVPGGSLELPPEAQYLAGYDYDAEVDWRLVQDPEQLDAIMLQQEYDPTKQQREKQQLQNEINKHNQAVTVSTRYDCGHHAFFKSLKAGDKFWTSVDKQYIVSKVATKGRSNKWYITVVNMDQEEVQFYFEEFMYKRLYRDQPRSFSREVKK